MKIIVTIKECLMKTVTINKPEPEIVDPCIYVEDMYFSSATDFKPDAEHERVYTEFCIKYPNGEKTKWFV